jgi:nucleoside-diphosphate-sugar epimerase
LEGGEIEVWGDGKQTRSFLYIDECIEATRRLMNHTEFFGPVNIGSEEMVTIDQLVEIASKVENKKVVISYIDGPVGVRGRNSNNDLIKKELNWNYSFPLDEGIAITYNWIKQQIEDENDE